MIANSDGLTALGGHEFKRARLAETADDLEVLFESPSVEPVCIRRCTESDHGAIRRLCCETGFLGQPVDSLFCDRELFADLFTRPYLDYESKCGIVAEADGRVVGYLLGSVRCHFDWLQIWSGFQTASKMALRLAAGRYASHPRSRKFIQWLFTTGQREQPRHPRNAAHLHLDIEKHYRARGLGRKMWEIYERRLGEAGIRRCYGAFFSHAKRRPEIAYARYGFTVFDRRRTTMFEPEIADVDVVCVSKEL